MSPYDKKKMTINYTFSSLKSSVESCHPYGNRKGFVLSWNCNKKKESCVCKFLHSVKCNRTQNIAAESSRVQFFSEWVGPEAGNPGSPRTSPWHPRLNSFFLLCHPQQMSLPNMVNLWIQDNHSNFNPLCTLGKDTRECEGQEVKGLLSPFKGFPENSISLDDIASHVLLQSSPAAEEAGQYKLFSWVPCFLKEYQNFFEK